MLEQQLVQQNSLKEVLDKVQRRTQDLSEIVQTGLKQKEEELKAKENEIFKREKALQEEEEVELALEERKLQEEERRLELLRDEMLRGKQHQTEELERLRTNRRQLKLEYLDAETVQKNSEIDLKEILGEVEQKVEVEKQKREKKQRYLRLDQERKDTELANIRDRINKEKKEFD